MKQKRVPRSALLGMAAGVAAGAAMARDGWGATPFLQVVSRPQDLESPLAALTTFITPKEQLFIRSHMGPPVSIDLSKWRLEIRGALTKPVSYVWMISGTDSHRSM